jgi:predicted nucleic acid-binding Zn ribbon protein
VKRSHSPERLGVLVESYLAQRGLLAACREQAVIARWGELVGPQVAAVTECQRAEHGVLYVRVCSAAWRHELAYLKPQLLAKVRPACSTLTDIAFC